MNVRRISRETISSLSTWLILSATWILSASLLLLLCVSATTRAQDADEYPANWCRTGLFAADKSGFKMAKVSGNWTARIHFLNDDDGCPSSEVKCETKSYLVTGDQVLVSRKFGSWVCSWYQPKKGGETVGWLQTDKLVMLPSTAASPALESWVGRWKYGKNSFDIQRDVKTGVLKVNGYAVWEGLNDNAHVGGIETAAQPQGNQLDLVEEECRVSLKLIGDYIVANDNNGCGGVNVRLNGVYTRASAKSVATVASNGVQAKGAQADRAQANDSLSFIRGKYESINKSLARYRAVKKELSGFSIEGGELTAYLDGTDIVKIAVTNQGETYRSFEEFYYSDEKLIFVFVKEERYNEPYSGKVAKTTESRLYFSDSKLIRWIEGKAKQVAKSDSRYLEQQTRYLNNSKLFTEGARAQAPSIENP